MNNKYTGKYFAVILIIFLLLFSQSIIFSVQADDITNSNEEINNPFSDYRSSNTDNENNENTEEKKNETAKSKNVFVEIENKREKPSFVWQGLVVAGEKYQVLLRHENESFFLNLGDKINGYELINIDVDKLTFQKDNYIYYVNMGRKENEKQI